MSTVTLSVAKATPAQIKAGQATVAQAKANCELSNRTDTVRLAGILASVMAVLATGKSVEITDLFPAYDPKTGKPNTAPAYHLAHRSLSSSLVRPDWHKVAIVPIVTATAKATKATITGETSTTAKVGTVRLFIAPANY